MIPRAATIRQRADTLPAGPRLLHVKTPSLSALALAAIPFVAMCFSVTLWDRIEPMFFGVPFNLCWLILWIVLTPCFMWGAYRIEAAAERRGERRP